MDPYPINIPSDLASLTPSSLCQNEDLQTRIAVSEFLGNPPDVKQLVHTFYNNRTFLSSSVGQLIGKIGIHESDSAKNKLYKSFRFFDRCNKGFCLSMVLEDGN